jgi:hypothetical protein
MVETLGILRAAQDDGRKRTTAKATAWWPGDGLHPTHRKLRDGWGTRFVVAGRRRQKQQQIPFGDDNQRGKDNGRRVVDKRVVDKYVSG